MRGTSISRRFREPWLPPAGMARGGAVPKLITLAGGDQEAGAPLSPRGSQNLTKCIGITSVPDAFGCRMDLKIEDFRIAREGPGSAVGMSTRSAPLKAEASLSATDGDFPPLPPNDQIDPGMFQKAPANGWNQGRKAGPDKGWPAVRWGRRSNRISPVSGRIPEEGGVAPLTGPPGGSGLQEAFHRSVSAVPIRMKMYQSRAGSQLPKEERRSDRRRSISRR